MTVAAEYLAEIERLNMEAHAIAFEVSKAIDKARRAGISREQISQSIQRSNAKAARDRDGLKARVPE